MPAPQLTFQASRTGISSAAGFDSVSVTFSADMAYTQFQCRATKSGEAYGVDVGTLVASFSYTPANTPRTFEIYDEHLLNGDGDYRISLFALGEDGAWNDNHLFLPSGAGGLVTADGAYFLCVR